MTDQPVTTIQNWPFGQPAVQPLSYCNGVGIAVSPWDFTFQFALASVALTAEHEVTGAEATPKPPELSLAQEVVARLVMSPQHVKAFHALLTTNIANYESQFGEIPLLGQTARSAEGN
jgi:hypothetical protein